MVYGWLREASGSSGGQARSGRGRLTRAGEDGGGGGKGKRAASTSSANPSARGGRCPAAGARDKSRGKRSNLFFLFGNQNYLFHKLECASGKCISYVLFTSVGSY
jgi:hypothetical protein